jgi:hypothetical protein
MAALPPAITSHRAASYSDNAGEILDSYIRLTFAADGGARPKSGGTPFRQPCPAYPSTIGRKAPQERFSEESFRNLTPSRNVFLYRSTASSPQQPAQKYSQHTASLDVLAEPNYYSKLMRTSSTRVFASHCKAELANDFDGHSSALEERSETIGELSVPPLADSSSSLYTTGFPIPCGRNVLESYVEDRPKVEEHNQDRSKSRLKLTAETGTIRNNEELHAQVSLGLGSGYHFFVGNRLRRP